MFRRNLLLCVPVVFGLVSMIGCGGGGSSLSPNPSGTPTATPTQKPSALVLTPSSIAVNGAGSAYAQKLVVSETSYAGAFSESDTCSGIATVSPTTGSGPALNIVVTGVASGSCAVTIIDGNGQKSTASVVVTISTVVIN